MLKKEEKAGDGKGREMPDRDKQTDRQSQEEEKREGEGALPLHLVSSASCIFFARAFRTWRWRSHQRASLSKKDETRKQRHEAHAIGARARRKDRQARTRVQSSHTSQSLIERAQEGTRIKHQC